MRSFRLLSAVVTASLSVLLSNLYASPGEGTLLSKVGDSEGGFGTLDNGDVLGDSLENLGDLDGDGVTDLIVGASGDDTGGAERGAVYILFMKSDGTVKSSSQIADGVGGLPANTLSDTDLFGTSVTNLGDLDNDGVTDVAVGALYDDTGGADRGAVYVLFLNKSGTIKSFTKIADQEGGFTGSNLQNGAQFGSGLARIPDLDGDGNPELAVGANGSNFSGTDRGGVYILRLNSDGTTRAFTLIADGVSGLDSDTLQDEASFGTSITYIGDLNGDTFPDIAVGASGQDSSAGSVHILFLSSAGPVVDQMEIANDSGGLSAATLTAGDKFGQSVTMVPDLDGDGIPDLAVGASGNSSGQGAIYNFFLQPDGSSNGWEKIANGVNGFPAMTLSNGDGVGSGITYLGDIDGDYQQEIAVGAFGDSTNGPSRGAIYILSLGDPAIVVTTLADELDTPSGANISLREAVRDAEDFGDFQKIVFDPSLDGGTIVLGGTSIDFSAQQTTISGQGLDNGIAISGNNLSRIFLIGSGSTITLECLELKDGSVSAAGGGAIAVEVGSTIFFDSLYIHDSSSDSGGGAISTTSSLRIQNSTFESNSAPLGGAILSGLSGTTLDVVNSTFSGNVANMSGASGGAAIANITDGSANVRLSTFIENTSNASGSFAVYSASGPIHAESCAFAGNSDTVGVEATGSFTEENNFELSLSDFAPLGDYGGKTPTQPLLETSSAKDMAAYVILPQLDQRSFARQRGAGIDPGASEAIEFGDVQPDNTIGEKLGRQKGNNVYNASGAGQKVKVKLKGRKKFKTFMTVQNDGTITNTITLRSNKPNKRTLKLKVRQLGRGNVTAALLRGYSMRNLRPGQSVAFRADYKRKSKTKKARGKMRFTSSSSLFGRSDTVQAKIKSLRD